MKNNTVLILDWSKWSGKTSFSKAIQEIIKSKIQKEFIILSLDDIRQELNLKANAENNEIAFQNILKSAKDYWEKWIGVIIDCWLIEEKLKRLENTLKNSTIYKIFLDGKYQDLKKRVQKRDKKQGKKFNEKRFDELYHLMRNKSFDWYSILDTSSLTKNEIIKKAIEKIITKHN